MRRLGPVVMAVASLAACGGSSGYGGGGGGVVPCTAATAQATTSVSLSGMAFVPSCVKIAAGATITFQNADAVSHTVTTDAGQPETFDSGLLAHTAEFMHGFANATETVHVHCSVHPSMTATILVGG